jgi:hypothetical protein
MQITLPPELIVQIASFLPTNHLLPLLLVDRETYAAVNSPEQWRDRIISLFNNKNRENEIYEFEKRYTIDWYALLKLVQPGLFSCFDPNRCAPECHVYDGNTRFRFESETRGPNRSTQTKNHIIPYNGGFYLWEVKVITHEACNMSVGLSDDYFSLGSNFVGYKGMKAQDDVIAPSYSISSDGVRRWGADGSEDSLHDVASYGSGDSITIVADFNSVGIPDLETQDPPTLKYYVNGVHVGDVACEQIQSSRPYYFTMTLYHEEDDAYISSFATSVNPPDGKSRPYVYSIALADILPFYEKYMENQKLRPPPLPQLTSSVESNESNSNSDSSVEPASTKRKCIIC